MNAKNVSKGKGTQRGNFALKTNVGSTKHPCWLGQPLPTMPSYEATLEEAKKIALNCDNNNLVWFLFCNEKKTDVSFRSKSFSSDSEILINIKGSNRRCLLESLDELKAECEQFEFGRMKSRRVTTSLSSGKSSYLLSVDIKKDHEGVFVEDHNLGYALLDDGNIVFDSALPMLNSDGTPKSFLKEMFGKDELKDMTVMQSMTRRDLFLDTKVNESEPVIIVSAIGIFEGTFGEGLEYMKNNASYVFSVYAFETKIA